MQQQPQPLPSLLPPLPSLFFPPPPLLLGQAAGKHRKNNREGEGGTRTQLLTPLSLLVSSLLSAPPRAPNLWQDPQLFTVRSKEERLQGLDQHAGAEEALNDAEKALLVEQAKQNKKNFAPFKPPRPLSSSLLPRSRRSLIKQYPGDHDPYINHGVGAKETDVPMHDHDDKTEDPDADDPKTHSLFRAVAASVVASPHLSVSVPAAPPHPSAQTLSAVPATAVIDTPLSPRTADGNIGPPSSCAFSVPPSSPPLVSASSSARTILTTAERSKKYRDKIKQLKSAMHSPPPARKGKKARTLTTTPDDPLSHEQTITHLLTALDDPRVTARIRQIVTSTIQS